MAKKKVLIAEDNEMMHQIYAECIGDGYEFLHAYDGVSALMLAVDKVPDLIVLDIMMPFLDGRTLCKKLKDYPKTKDVKIIMVSAKDSQSDRLVGFEVGADDYIDKSSAGRLLARSVKHLLP